MPVKDMQPAPVANKLEWGQFVHRHQPLSNACILVTIITAIGHPLAEVLRFLHVPRTLSKSWWNGPALPAVRAKKTQDQKPKACLGYRARMPAWET